MNSKLIAIMGAALLSASTLAIAQDSGTTVVPAGEAAPAAAEPTTGNVDTKPGCAATFALPAPSLDTTPSCPSARQTVTKHVTFSEEDTIYPIAIVNPYCGFERHDGGPPERPSVRFLRNSA
ncbi:MAG: hypothetical protein OSA96_00435, partial [Aurantimonas coralicida]|nr:hypothetical protein [Aurantimonas coralicida]